MSTDVLTLKANKRDVLGKQVRGLRASGQTPAVIHDHGKPSMHITVAEADLKKIFSQAGKHATIELDLDGTKYTTLIKELTNKPATNKIYHSVFQAINATETVSTEVPLKLSEDNPATKASLLVLQKIDFVEIEALSKDLIDFIEVDTSSLAEVGDKISVSDLKVPSTITITTDPDQAIATVEMPKDQIAEADAAQAELAADAGSTAEETTEGEEEGEATESAEEE